MDVLIERESELAVLDEVVGSAVSGQGGAVLIEGEAGIGKTRLIGKLARARAKAAGLRVLYATADEIETGVPFAGARVLLGRAARDVALDGPARLGALALAGALPDPNGPGSRGDEVVHALWWVIVELADERPLALFLDDAQWADELTLALLRMAARRARELPLALIVAARPWSGHGSRASRCREVRRPRGLARMPFPNEPPSSRRQRGRGLQQRATAHDLQATPVSATPDTTHTDRRH